MGLAAGLAGGVADARAFFVVRTNPDAWTIIDPTSIEALPGGGVRRMWTVTVQRNILGETPAQPGYVRAVNEYDCAAQKLRWNRFTAFSRSGAVLLNRENATSDWTDVAPSGGVLVEWRVACGQSTGDSVIEADGIAKVVIALMRSWDPAPDALAIGTVVAPPIAAKPGPPPVAASKALPAPKPKAPPPAGAKAP